MKKYGIIGLVALLLLGLGYAFGRWQTPSHEIVIDKTSDITEQMKSEFRGQIRQELTQEFDAYKASFLAMQKKEEHISIRKEQRPDGTVITNKTIDTKAEASTAVNTEKEQAKLATATDLKLDLKLDTLKIDHEVFHSQERWAKKPDWIIGVTAGTLIKEAVKSGIGGSYIFGGEVSRRIFGPIFLGVWVDSRAAVGLAARLEL